VISALKGHEITVLNDAELATYKKLLAPVTDEWLAEMKSKGLDGQGVLKRTREVISKTN
jgi:hypothetical protein